MYILATDKVEYQGYLIEELINKVFSKERTAWSFTGIEPLNDSDTDLYLDILNGTKGTVDVNINVHEGHTHLGFTQAKLSRL